MDHDSEAALRRVAIVLSSLPEPTVARLMMGLGPDQQRAVRAAIGRLTDVDPLERHRVLDAFAASVRRGTSPRSSENDAAEIVLSSAALRHHGRHQSGVTAATASAPLAFLSEVQDDALAAEIGQEHPQTIAIILAALAPAQAARLLQRLDVGTRQETMRRLAKLDAPSPEVINDIGGQLRTKLLANGARFVAPTGRPANAPRGKLGQEALRAILAAMPVAAEPPPQGASSAPASPAAYDSALVGGALSDDPADRWQGQSLGAPSAHTFRAAHADQRRTGRTDSPVPTPESADAIHARLIALPTERLRQALASVETRLSLLALCGLPRATADKVLASLPRRQARQVRRQLAELGTIELREIDRAKAVVAMAADKMNQDPYGHAVSPADASARQAALIAA